MGKVGRFVCVSVPFILTVLSIIFLLVAALSGVTNKSLYMFEIDLSELSIDKNDINSLINSRALGARDILDDVGEAFGGGGDGSDAADAVADATGASDGITPADLGLNELYKVSVWGYCSEKSDGDDEKCTKPKMDWAKDELDTAFIEDISKALGSDFKIPDEIKTALDTFKTVSKWTQIVFIIALAALAAQIIVGVFSVCTRIASCLCFIIAGVSTVAAIAAAALSTATATVIVGAIEGSDFHGAKGSVNTSFLALVWVAVACAIGAAMSWLVTICCCAPDKSSRRSHKNRGGDNEKGFTSSAYQPLQDPQSEAYGHGANSGHGQNDYYSSAYNSPSFNGAQPYPNNGRSDMAYEPYSHRA